MVSLVLAALAGCATQPTTIAAASCEVKQLTELPVTMFRRLPVVPVKIGDVDATMVLDTGAARLLVTDAALPRFDLRVDRNQRRVSRQLSGAAVTFPATIDRLILGQVDLGRRDALVVPFNFHSASDVPDGFLAGSILFIFDLDIDIPGRKVTLYMPRRCADGAPPWPTPYATLETRATTGADARLAINVTVNGHNLIATIDTGAEISVISRSGAAAAGVTAADLARDRGIATQGFGSGSSVARLHRFAEIRIAGETTRDALVAVADFPAAAGDMLLGEDWLRTRRVWLSYTSRRIYVMPSTPAVAP